MQQQEQQQHGGDEQEEEVAALVPPPAQKSPDDHAAAGSGGVVDDDDDPEAAAAVDNSNTTPSHRSSNLIKEAAWWWRRRLLAPTKLLVPTRSSMALVVGGLVVLALLVGSSGRWWINLDDYASSSFLLGGGVRQQQHRQRPPHHVPSPAANLVPIPFSCGGGGSGNSSSSGATTTTTCRRRRGGSSAEQLSSSFPSPSPSQSPDPPAAGSGSRSSSPPRCPEYFRYIHSDLSPWRETGISREAVERGRPRAAFRLVVVGGRAYVETYHRVFQTRDTFTQWGIAQLLARYPGRVPDLDLMFNCEDMPEVRRADYDSSPPPPPLFRYCKDGASLDVVFPDWSFWGWPEVNIRPWAPLLAEMAAEAARLPWPRREPYAFWKGNPGVSADRRDLLRCNSTERWGARVFAQDWGAAARRGFRDSNLARQCRYRYKVYVRGRSWSVSEKYILACDSPVLLVDTPFADFFSRGLVAGEHYWPIDPARKCPAIKLAVDWGNAHPAQARRMAQEGSDFARRQLAMDYVYDYMLHLLTQYAALLRYKPTVPENAVELCPEAVACPADRSSREFRFMMESRERHVADYEPCTLPPPFTDEEVREMARREQQVRANVQKMMMMMESPSKHK